MKNKLKFFALSVSILLSALSIQAQTGGTYDLSHNVIAAGGGTSGAGNFVVEGTVGQPSAGTNSAGGNYNLRGGFWAFQALAPTAAQVSISGRVVAANGTGIRNAIVTLTDAGGRIKTARTGSFGYYRFEEIEVGQTCVLEVHSKRFAFANPTLIVSVSEEISEANFTALPF